jgi:hypothetical protein
MLHRILSSYKSKRTSLHRTVSFLRFSPDPAAQAIVEVYDAMNTGDRDYVPIEALCIKAEVNPLTVFGAACAAARVVMGQESAMTTIVEHPEVVRRTIQFAKELPGASKDREMVHQAVGWLPTSKGVSMNVNLMGGNAQLTEGDDDDSIDDAFPSIGKEIEGWSEDRRRALTDGK